MHQREINYTSPKSLEEAFHLLDAQRGDFAVIAGGTDLLPQLRSGVRSAEHLIDLRQLPLDYIDLEQDQLRLGARVTHAMILESSDIATIFPALVEACRSMAGPSIRNRATLSGNLVNASPAADSAPPLLVYDAIVVLEKQGSQRLLPLDQFFAGPGETVIEPDELLTEIRIPIPRADTKSKFIKLGNRGAMAIAVASAAVRLSFDQDQKVSDARIALGSVAPTPVRALSAEDLLEGARPSRSLFDEVAKRAEEAASPISDIRASRTYRKEMVYVLVSRCLNLISDEHREDRA